MSRNDLFLLLACFIAAATLSAGPISTAHGSRVTIASLLLPPLESGALTGPAMLQSNVDHQ